MFIINQNLIDDFTDKINEKEKKNNKVTSWGSTTTDAHYPSEKLVKDSLDSKASSSHTHGNLQNNGQVGSTAQANKNVVTDSSGKITTEDKPTIPSASSTTPSADTTNGSVGTGTTWARSNHTHPKSSLYAESSHAHTDKEDAIEFITGTTTSAGNVLGGTSTKLNSLQNGTKILYKTPVQSSTDVNTAYLQLTLANGTTSRNYLCDATGGFLMTKEIPANTVLLLVYVTSFQSRWQIISRSNDATTNSSGLMSKTDKSKLDGLSNFSGSYNDLTDKPTIPTSTSDLTNDSGFLTSHQSLSGYLQTSDVKDNLTSTDTDKPLSAKQGKELKSLIDNKEDKIYRIVGTGTQIGTLFPNRVELQGTFPFDSVNGKIIVYVVPDISSLSEDLLLDLQGTYPSGSTTKFNIRKSNDAPISIGEIQTGDELLLFYDNSRWRLIGNSSISGKIDTAGAGLSKSGTTLNHSNSITALTTASFKKVKYDGQGHITGTSDVSASDLPSHNHTKSQITDFPTIPSKTSDLVNDNGFLTSHQSLSGYLQTSDVKDNLTSTDIDKPLSAKQGKELKTLVDGKADSGHTHSQYLTEHQSLANYVTTSDSRLSDSRTPIAHATSATTYGVSSASNYGHAMASSTSPKANGTAAVGSETAKFARGDHVHPHNCVNNLTSTSTTTPLAANQGKVLNEKKLEKTTQSTITVTEAVSKYDNLVNYITLYSGTGPISAKSNGVECSGPQTRVYCINTSGLGTLVSTNNEMTLHLLHDFNNIYIGDTSSPSIATNQSEIDITIGRENNIVYVVVDHGNTKFYNWDSRTDPYPDLYIRVFGQPASTLTVTETTNRIPSSQEVTAQINAIADVVYPVGSIYMSVNSTSPQTLFGGRWEQLKDRFLLGSGSTYSNGSTGGSANAVVVGHSHGIENEDYYFVGKKKNDSAGNKRVSVPTSGSNYAYVSSASSFGNFGGTHSQGVNGTGKNMPPYLVVYMWKRIA